MTQSIKTPFGPLTRRDWLRLSTLGVLGTSVSGWLGNVAVRAAEDPRRQRACILLWMAGGPSQLETWDPKPAHANGGPTKEIDTSVPGIKISEHLPQMAKWMDHLAIFRSINSTIEDHGQGAILMSTGYKDGGPVDYPSFGAAVAKELDRNESPLPSYVSIRTTANDGLLPGRTYGPGFLGPRHAPLSLVPGTDAMAQAGDRLEAYNKLLALPYGKLATTTTEAEANARIDLLREMDREFVTAHPGKPGQSHQSAYDRAARLLLSPAAKAFALEEETVSVRDSYGRNFFGQGCLLARRLIERGVNFVEVTLGGTPGQARDWDMHGNIFNDIPPVCAILDKGWSALMADLKASGLLETTLIVWMGEFGRTPGINGAKGRDHWAKGWSTVLAGGGINGGQVIGKTSADGMKIDDHPVMALEFLATAYAALGIDPHKQNHTLAGRPIRLVDAGIDPVKEALR